MPSEQQRVALVTGASRGVGWGVATALQQRGWRVYGTSRHGTGPDETVALSVDHADDEAVAAAFARVADDTGRLDLLVNNAWASPPGFAGFTAKFFERPLSDWDSLIGIGLRSHYVAAVHAAQVMVPQGSGLIASTSSFGSRGHLHSVLYGVGKTGVDKMAFDMGAELAGTGVAAVSLWLGLIRTPLLLGSGLTEFAGFPVSRAEDPGFVGRVVAALANDPGLPELNGHTIVTAEYGAAHGITNDDGETVPDSHRAAFGGGPLFPPSRETD